MNPTRAAGKTVSIAYQFTDTQETFSLLMRNGILEIQPRIAPNIDALLVMSRAFVNRIWSGSASYESGLASGDIKLTGAIEAVAAFYAILDTPEDLANPYMVLR